MDLPRLEDLPDLEDQRVLLRVDFNVPLRDGVVDDDLRITTALPTVTWLCERGARVVTCGHLGRPKGKPKPGLSMAPVAARLSELLGTDVALAPGIEGPKVESFLASMCAGDVVMLENLRFDPGEESNDPAFATNLSACCAAYVNEAFGASHRAHASIVGPPVVLPSAGGRLLFCEVEVLSQLLDNPKRPFVGILGGVKVSDKLGVIEALLQQCDLILIGGAMAFTFVAARGGTVGDSPVESEMLDECRRLLATGRVQIPTDVAIARDAIAGAETRHVAADEIPAGWKGLDVGPETAGAYADVVASAATVVWNGPMGMFEVEPFDAGTRTVADAMANTRAFTVIGGGDSASAVRHFGLADRIDHVSTGGGATLEFIEQGDLPGLAALRHQPS